MSLVLSGEYKSATVVVDRVKGQISNRNSQPYIIVRLLEAIVSNLNGELNKALGVLKEVESKKGLLGEYARCRLYHCYVSSYDKLADEHGVDRYNPLLEESAYRNGFVHEYLTAISARFNQLFNKSMLVECKQLVRRAMAVASRSKSYYHLSRLFFMASAVYYEEGSYESSIRYVRKALQLSISLGLMDEVPDLMTRLAMNYRNMGLYGNALRYLDKAQALYPDNFEATKRAVSIMFSWDLHMEVNDQHVEDSRVRARKLMADLEGKHWQGYYWHNTGMYYYYRCEMNHALDAMRKAKRLYIGGGATDDAVRSGIKEAIILIELGEFRDAKLVIKSLEQFRRDLESKNIHGEYCALQLAYHYHFRSSPSVLKKHLEICENAFLEVKEMPVLLMMESLMFRVRARLGDVRGARNILKGHLRKIKKIVSNMPNREYASLFLNKHDERLLMWEYKLTDKKKGAQASRAPGR